MEKAKRIAPEKMVEIRRKNNMSQFKMALMLGGYTVRCIQMWEEGKNRIPPAVCVLLPLLFPDDFKEETESNIVHDAPEKNWWEKS